MDAIVKSGTPEEREYDRYLGEVEIRKRHVTGLQADLQLLKEKLGTFNAEYHTRVGVLFVEIDKIHLSIKEYEYRIAHLQSDPDTTPEDLEQETRDRFSEKHEEVHQDEEETRRYERTYREDQHLPQLDEQSESTLKALFRDLAKRFHPDLARTDAERQQREAIMKRVNAAFHERDIEALEAITAETVLDDPAFEARGIGEKLVWAIREVSRLDGLVAAIVAEREALLASDLAQLLQRQEAGENIIERLEHTARHDVEQAQQRLQEAIESFRQSVSEVNFGQ